MRKPWSLVPSCRGEPEGLHLGQVELGQEGVVEVGDGDRRRAAHRQAIQQISVMGGLLAKEPFLFVEARLGLQLISCRTRTITYSPGLIQGDGLRRMIHFHHRGEDLNGNAFDIVRSGLRRFNSCVKVAEFSAGGHEFQISVERSGGIDSFFAFMTRCEENLRRERAGKPHKFIYPVIEIRQYVFDCLCCAVIEDEAEFVAFVAGAGLGAPGDVFAVGGVGGGEVAAGRGAEGYRLRRWVGEVEGEDLRADADGLHGVDIVSEGELPGVGRECAAATAALQRKGWNVVGIVGREIAYPTALNRNQKEVGALVAGEVVPVAEEQPGEDLRLHLAGG